MVVVFRDEVAEVDDRHGLLESRMESGTGKFGRSHPRDLFHDGMTGVAEVGENVGNRAAVVIGFVGLAVLEIGGVESLGAAGVIVEALVP